MEPCIQYRKSESVAIIEFDRPNVLNAYDTQTMQSLIEAFESASTDEEVKAVVWQATGRAWCAGADIKFLAALQGAAGAESFLEFINLEERSTRIIMNCEKPIIAAINGYALGGGCEYAMLADIRIAAEGAHFGFPETSIGGVVTHGGTKLLPALVGLGKAKELILTGEMIDAYEAARIGLINRVVPAAELEQTTIELAGKIATSPRRAVAAMRHALNHAADWSFEEALQYESYASLQLQTLGMYSGRTPGRSKGT